MNMFPLLV